MTRLHRRVPNPLRAALERLRRLQPPPPARPAEPVRDESNDLSGLILYGQG